MITFIQFWVYLFWGYIISVYFPGTGSVFWVSVWGQGPKALGRTPQLSQAVSREMVRKCSNWDMNLCPTWMLRLGDRGLASGANAWTPGNINEVVSTADFLLWVNLYFLSYIQKFLVFFMKCIFVYVSFSFGLWVCLSFFSYIKELFHISTNCYSTDPYSFTLFTMFFFLLSLFYCMHIYISLILEFLNF